MEDVKLQRMLLEAAVDQGIREIERDLHRSVRRLVDLGKRFSRGRFQSQIFTLFQGLLANENSPYYELIRRLVREVDHETLKTVGVNVGFESWTNGAKRIRETEKARGVSVPWTRIFHMAPGDADGSGLQAYERSVEADMALGIHTFLLQQEGGMGENAASTAWMRRYPQCVFVYYLRDARMTEEGVEAFAQTHNAVLSIPAQSADAAALARRLAAHRCLYGAHWRYARAEDALDEEALRRLLELRCPLAFFIAEDCCRQSDREAVAHFALEARTQQRYPMILMDLYEDTRYVNRIISGPNCPDDIDI